MAAAIQRQTDQQELQCSLLALAAKAGLVLLGCVSLIRLSVAYQERMDRHSEIAAVVSIETAKLETLQHRWREAPDQRAGSVDWPQSQAHCLALRFVTSGVGIEC